MGYMSALGMAEHAPLETAIRWHLTSNHYPPLPESLAPVALRAIKYAKRGEWERNLRLPDGISWRGKKSAPVSVCVESWHLEAFLEAGS